MTGLAPAKSAIWVALAVSGSAVVARGFITLEVLVRFLFFLKGPERREKSIVNFDRLVRGRITLTCQ